MTGRTALILDVDTGIDDSLALLYAAASPDAELIAATCVSGNIDAAQVAINTRAVLELAGRTDVEVAVGRETPLLRALETTPETHGPQGLGHAELPPPSRPISTRHGVRPDHRGGSPPARRDHPGHARPADQPRPRGPARTGTPPPVARLHADGRRLRGVGQHDADHRVEHPLRSRGGQDRLPRVGRGVRGRSDHPAPARARARRDRAGTDPPRRRRPAGAPGREHARRFDRAGARRGPDAGDALGGEQSGRPLRRRCAALLHGVPRRLRRLLRGVHPRSTGRRGGARPVAGHDRGALRRCRDAGRDHDRR